MGCADGIANSWLYYGNKRTVSDTVYTSHFAYHLWLHRKTGNELGNEIYEIDNLDNSN